METQQSPRIQNVESIITECLRIMAQYTEASRVCLMIFVCRDENNRNFYNWPSEPITKSALTLHFDSPWWLHQLRSHTLLHVDAQTILPQDVAVERDRLLSIGIERFVLLPVFDGKRLIGTFYFENPLHFPAHNSSDVDLLKLAAQLVVKVICTSRALATLRRERIHLLYQGFHDPETGLPNRTAFLKRVQDALSRRQRLFGILLIEWNDYPLLTTCGETITHRSAGSDVIKILRSVLREEDLVARMDQNRFAILLEELQEEADAEMIAERILQRIENPISLSGPSMNLSASIGVALPNGHHQPPELLLQEAGIALLQAHQLGRNRFLTFTQSMREVLVHRIELECDLRNSLERQQLVLHYQPITELISGRLIGFEALLRWNHPTRGLIWPADFIRLSEETGLIVPLGTWALHEACRQMRIWQAEYPLDPPLTISVNISPRQLEQSNFSEQVAHILNETGLPPASLRLEITESTLFNKTPAAMNTLEALRKLGVQLYIDDFGTGYSSLGYLDSLPIDAIKIDRSFITNLGRVKSSAGVIQAIIQIARELSIEVVAEGVETFEQQSELKRLQCKFMQGFLVSHPLDPASVDHFIKSGTGKGYFTGQE
ncbi:MAG TPA: sensor domain-containing phosphodiesterase [Anaerolinea thermolimosa]|uniref:Sensor domain-containing phosphodiesterase n=1 Tax=Anaerolinea thermolimosa TaxID=229919 RepID=A0A3D1JHP7_9CHLR|nr:EAL domain-containing protein [Anaerolinea thermolimosa]GAP07053.1 protein containing diguanylate cyclase (GGDEF) domain [Anaerolinea thermolimosa]HCE18100.1 sensor domain-containing phosphodiesterase [Anaerolinea thermolimosa]